MRFLLVMVICSGLGVAPASGVFRSVCELIGDKCIYVAGCCSSPALG